MSREPEASSAATSSHVGSLSTHELEALFNADPAPVILWPLGSVEPHGPHLPLSTDRLLSELNAQRAATALQEKGVPALIAPSLAYGVTDFAEGFAGAISIPSEVLEGFLYAGARAWLEQGARHICLINHHLEPGQLATIKAAQRRIGEEFGAHRISAPQVISRRWGRLLGDEFRSGACHAGSYETSLVLVVAPELVSKQRAELPALEVSLSKAIGAGATRFKDIGMTSAYTGAPAAASREEGERFATAHQEMVVAEVCAAITALEVSENGDK